MPEKTYQAFYKSRQGGWTAWVREFADRAPGREGNPYEVHDVWIGQVNARLRADLPEIARESGGLPDPMPPVESVEDPHTHTEDIVIRLVW